MSDPAPAQVQSKQDTPLSQPPTTLERWTSAIGNLARPFAIYVTAASAAGATIIMSARVDPSKLDLSAAAIFLGASYTGVAALYASKSYENAQAAKQDATVKVAQAQSTTTP